MGRFARLTSGKGKSVEIDGEKFELTPLTGKYLGLFMELGDKQNHNKDAMIKLITASFGAKHPEITQDDVEELPLGVLTKVMEVVMEINELT